MTSPINQSRPRQVAQSRHEPAGFFVALWTGAFLIVAALIAAANAQQVTPSNAQLAQGLVRPGDMGFGGLLLDSKQAGYYIEAPLVATDVDITITGPIARTRVTQRFQNPSDGWVEGIYVFPMPDEASVDTLRMIIGGRVIEGLIKEREEARYIYQQAKAQGYKASLVEQQRPNIFTNSVANIGPHETVIIQIEYQEHVRLDNGQFSLRFPMVVGPRYNPLPLIQMVNFNERGWGSLSDPVPDRDRIEPPYLRPDEDPEAPKVNPVTLTISLRTGFALGDIASSHHDIDIRRNGNDGATLTLKQGEVAANKDFELVWSPKAGTAPEAALFRETFNGEDYLLAIVVPPRITDGSEAVIRPRETIFVIDNSGSMGGESIRQARASLLMALDRLRPTDLFNVIRFDNTMDMVFANPVPANPTNVTFAKQFVARLEANGGTEMLPALEAALFDLTPTDTSRVRQVIFLTDGAIGNEAQLFSAIDRSLGRSRLFTVGIGSAPNSYFMSRAARLGRGTFTHIGNEDQVRTRMVELFEKLERPVMTDLAAQWPFNNIAEAWPNPLPDLYAGEPVVLTAKLKKADGVLHIAGDLNGSPWLAELPLDKAIDGHGIAKLWARKKIAAIEETRFMGADWQQVDQAVLAVALDYHLVSRLTSLVAVDVTPSRPMDEGLVRRDVPLNLPDGWDFDKVFGGPDFNVQPTSIERADRGNMPVQFAALEVADMEPAMAMTQQKGLVLPQGATPADRMILTGALSLLLAFALWVVYRRPRRAQEVRH